MVHEGKITSSIHSNVMKFAFNHIYLEKVTEISLLVTILHRSCV